MKIDIYTHIFPEKFYKKWLQVAPSLADIGKRMTSVRPVFDLNERFRMMDQADDYRQIISLPNPPLETITTPEVGAELAGVANDTMAELVNKHPNRFPGFVASLALHNFDAAMDEIDRAIKNLGAKGIQIFTQVKGKPLDDLQFQSLFAKMIEYDLPIWLHPGRPAMVKDYGVEEKSRFELWWALGWPYDTSVAMARLVFNGLFDRHPAIKIITHHCGGMIPYFEGRLDAGLKNLGARTSDDDYSQVLGSLRRPHAEYFKMFYADTAMFGAVIGTKCGLEFFGADRIVFATDCPFAPFVETIDAMSKLGLNDVDLDKVYCRNAEKLMNTRFQ